MVDDIKKYLEAHEEEMLGLLERVVRINSYSANKAGVDAVADVLDEAMRSMGFSTRRDQQSEAGDNLVAENAARVNGGGGALLIGHMDTVFPPDMGFDCFERQEGGRIHGPGTYDMKGGIVAGIYALKALDAAGLLADMPVAYVCNSDEEIGSPYSREVVVEEAGKSKFCFVMEGCGANGEVVTGRKGRKVFTLDVTGKAGHAGRNAYPKASAIQELARQVSAMEALNNPETGTSVNIGQIKGGVGPNTVSASAWAKAETRFVNPEEGERVWKAIEEIAGTPVVEGVHTKLEVLTSRPAWVTGAATLGLYDVVENSAKELNIPVSGVFRGGGSDANVVAQVGTPVVDGMGPSGGKLHTPEEYFDASTMVERTLLAAVSIRRAFEAYK